MYRETGLVNSPPPSAQDDAALLALVQRGDEGAMASLFDRYSKIVYSVALRVLRDPASAEDVLQEVFMQIWRNPSGFVATRGSLGGWLAVVARNRSIDALRRKRPSEQVDDMVLACGGTQIDGNNQDVVWNDATPFDVSVLGGGGWGKSGQRLL